MTSTVGSIVFNSTIDGDMSGMENLVLNSATTVALSGAIGGITPLASLTVSGTTITQSAPVITTGAMSYTGLISLGGDITTSSGMVDLIGAVTLSGSREINTSSGGGANIGFSSTIDGAGSLTLLAGTSGTVYLNGIIGGTTRLVHLEVTGQSIFVPTLIQTDGNTQEYFGPLFLAADSVFDELNGDILFHDTISGVMAIAHDLTITAVGGEIVADGTIDIDGLIANGSEGSTFSDAITALGDVSISSSNGNVTVGSITTTGGLIELHPNGTTTLNGGGDYSPNGVLFINGDLTASTSINLEAVPTRTELANIATIAGDPLGANLTITAGSLTIGDFETLTVFGDVTFTISGNSIFGDIVALGTIAITSGGTNTIFSSAPGLIYDSFGILYTDEQTNILSAVANPNLTISPAPSFTGATGVINEAVFSSSTLLFGSLVLTLDAGALPPPPPSPSPSPSSIGREQPIYDMQIAVAEMLFYRLPIWSQFKELILDQSDSVELQQDTSYIPNINQNLSFSSVSLGAYFWSSLCIVPIQQ